MPELNPKSSILKTIGVTKNFGGLVAIKSVSLDFIVGSITGVIGPNGAGKTTFFNVISGYLTATEGEVFLEGYNIDRLRSHEIVNKGMVRTFQVPQCCRALTVSENIRLACLRGYEKENINEKIEVFASLAGLDGCLKMVTGNLTIGFLRRVEIAMAVATKPKIILFDEPFSGLTDVECEETSSLIQKLSKNVTLVIIDHKLKHLMPIVDRVIVLNTGKVFFEGNPSEVSLNPDVQRIYIGGDINDEK